MRFQQINKPNFFSSLHELTLWVVECSPQSHKVKRKEKKKPNLVLNLKRSVVTAFSLVWVLLIFGSDVWAREG